MKREMNVKWELFGLYDTVEGKFYTNKGTGIFIAGPDVQFNVNEKIL